MFVFLEYFIARCFIVSLQEKSYKAKRKRRSRVKHHQGYEVWSASCLRKRKRSEKDQLSHFRVPFFLLRITKMKIMHVRCFWSSYITRIDRNLIVQSAFNLVTRHFSFLNLDTACLPNVFQFNFQLIKKCLSRKANRNSSSHDWVDYSRSISTISWITGPWLGGAMAGGFDFAWTFYKPKNPINIWHFYDSKSYEVSYPYRCRNGLLNHSEDAWRERTAE